MNYRVSKKRPDARTHTCGLFVLDGFSVVVELTIENMAQLENLKKFGYLVEATDAEAGGYDRNGRHVDYDSMKRNAVSGSELVYLDATDIAQATREVIPPVDDKTISAQSRYEAIRAELDAKGVRYHPASREDTLQRKLDEWNRQHAGGG